MGMISEQADKLRSQWATDARWAGIERTYSAEDVIRLRGPVVEEQTLARLGATRLWEQLHSEDTIRAHGASSPAHAVQLAGTGLQALHLPGWHASAGGHLAPHTYADHHSPHPAHPAPALVRQMNKALLRAGQVAWSEQSAEGTGRGGIAPVVADAEAGSGGALNAFELTTALIEAGAAGIQFEDRLSPDRNGRPPGGKVLIPTGQHIKTLNAARLAADVLDVPTIIIARTAASDATLLSSDVDERDREFLTGKRTEEGFHHVQPSLYASVTRGLAFAPYADLLWLEASTPNLAEARAFAQIIHSQYPDKMLAYSCSPDCDWYEHLDDEGIAKFQKELGEMGYCFQFIAQKKGSGMINHDIPSYVPTQDSAPLGYDADRHHIETGARYFNLVNQALAPKAEPAILAEHLEAEHFVSHDLTDHHGRLVPAD